MAFVRTVILRVNYSLCGAFLKFLTAQKPLSLTWRSKITHLALCVGSACCEWGDPFSDRRQIVSLSLWCPCWELFTPLSSAIFSYFTKSQNFRAHGIFPNLSMGFLHEYKNKIKYKSLGQFSLLAFDLCTSDQKQIFHLCVCFASKDCTHMRPTETCTLLPCFPQNLCTWHTFKWSITAVLHLASFVMLGHLKKRITSLRVRGRCG